MLRLAIIACVVLLVALLVLAALSPTTLKRWAYEEPGRDRWQQPQRVIDALPLRPGLVIADVGSGGGYFTFRLAEAVGETGRVYAADVDSGLNRYVDTQAQKRGLTHIVTVEAGAEDPHLPEAVDLLFTCNTVHHFADPATYFTTARRYLRPGARIAIVDYRDKHRSIPLQSLVPALGVAGFELERQFDFLDRQYFLLFRLARSREGG